MKKRHRRTVSFRVGIAAYLVATLLLPQGLVYCQSADGHTAIELAHNSCPEASGADGIEGEPLQGFQYLEEPCIDTSFMLPTIISRTGLEESFSLLVSLAKVVSIPLYAISTDCFSDLHWTFRYSPLSGASPTGVLRTTILLI